MAAPEDVTLEDTEDGVKFSDNFTSEYIGDKVQAQDMTTISAPVLTCSHLMMRTLMHTH